MGKISGYYLMEENIRRDRTLFWVRVSGSPVFRNPSAAREYARRHRMDLSRLGFQQQGSTQVFELARRLEAETL